MQIDKISVGNNPPEEVNAIIEIPACAEPIKYEIDKDSGAVFVDRFINVPMHYPCNYGFIPHTLSEDGDPVDVLVATPVPIMAGAVIPCRPVGMLEMSDESGRDLKVLAVPGPKMNCGYEDVQDISDLPDNLTQQIQHFFEYYKKLEPGKWVQVDNWSGREAAHKEIIAGMNRCRDEGK